jgi:ribonuclease P/MRP protein subunit RPP1
MEYYDLHIHTIESIGEDSLEEVVKRAKLLGLSGIGVAKFLTNGDKKWELPAVEGTDLVPVGIIKANSSEELNKMAKKVRKKVVVLMAHGGDYDINRAACENPMFDVLCCPEQGRKDSGLDHICVKAAKENNVAIEISFRGILQSFKKQRVFAISAIKHNIALCKKYETPMITTSSALSKWDMRGGRELAAVTYLLGIELTKAIQTVSTIPKSIVINNREKLENKRWVGVKVVEDDT